MQVKVFNSQIKVLTTSATAWDVATRDQPGTQGGIGTVRNNTNTTLRARFQQIIIDFYFLKLFSNYVATAMSPPRVLAAVLRDVGELSC